MRKECLKTIFKLAHKDKKLLFIGSDLGPGVLSDFKKKFPNRFFMEGVSEQAIIGLAAGLAMEGFRPYVNTIATFLTRRCFEQIRIDICYPNLPVIIVGTGSGLSYASLGATHHSMEDIAILKTIPDINILAPSDGLELEEYLKEALKSDVPTYIRIGKKGEPEITEQNSTLNVSGYHQIGQGGKLGIISVGTIASESLLAQKILEEKKIKNTVYLFQQIKPFPCEAITDVLSKHEKILIVEEHSKIGGFGESVKSFVCDNRLKNHIINLGTCDKFLPTVGNQNFARSFFKINSTAITDAGLILMENA